VNPDGFAAFALSETGTLLYPHMEPRLSRLAWVDRRGAATGIGAPHAQEVESFALSRDGHRVAAGVTRDGVPELWLYELPAGPWTRLMTGGDGNFRPDWEPSGTRIAFIMVQKNGIRAAWTIPADGGGSKQLLRQASPSVVQDGEWSPDGKWFVYRQGPSGPTQRDIFYARPEPDSAPHPLAMTAADEFAPTLSPDGHWLAYVSNASGREEVLVQPFPGPGRRFQVSLEGGLEPRWAHSGRELFYRDRTGNLVGVEVRTGATFAVGSRRILFPATGYLNDRNSILYDVAPDDQRFLFIQPVSGGEISWRLVRGFLKEVKDKMGK